MSEKVSIIATDEGGNFKLIEPGTYPARCYQMIYMGTIKENIMGKEMEMKKVFLTWELPTELEVFKEENGEQPHVVSKEFTLSMNEKANLRHSLQSWRGKNFTDEEAKSFDITKLIGAPCQLNLIHKATKVGKMRIEIAAITPLAKGQKCPIQINESVVFSVQQPDWDVFAKLSSFIQEKIKKSTEYADLQVPINLTKAEPSSDLPADFDETPEEPLVF